VAKSLKLSQKMQIDVLAVQIGNLCRAIKHIKDGRTGKGIEILEHGLDGCLIGLENLKKDGQINDPASKSLFIDAIKMARIHRRRYPRLSGQDADFEKIVQRILESIEDNEA
jgi:hypothetical protein